MAELPKLSDLPDDMTIGQLRRMTDMLSQPQAPSTDGFSPQLGRTFARERDPSMRETLADSLAPTYGLAGAERIADSPITGFGLDVAQGGKDFVTGSPAKGIARMVGGSGAVDGNSLFNRDDYRLPNMTDTDPTASEPGFMDAQAADRRRQQPAPLGPKALRSIEAGKGEAKALEIGAGADAEIKKAAAEAQRKREATEFDAKQADLKLRKPFRENHPDLAGFFEFGPAVAATAGGMAGRVAANRGIKAGAERLATLLDDFNKARAAGDLEGATLAKLAIESEKEALGTGSAATAKGFGAAGAGGGIANTAGTTLPEGYDARNMPDGPERQRAVDKILSLEGLGLIGSRFVTGALAGVGGYGGVGNLGRGKVNVGSKADAASAYGSEKFNETMGDLAGSSRYKTELGAAGDMVTDNSKALVKSNKADLRSSLAGDKRALKAQEAQELAAGPIAGGKLNAEAAPAIPSKAAAKQIAPPAATTQEKAVAKVKNEVASTKTKRAASKNPAEVKALTSRIEFLEGQITDLTGQLKDVVRWKGDVGG